MEKHYEGSNTLVLELEAHSKPLQICFTFFNIYGGSNIWYDFEYTGRVATDKSPSYIAIAHVQKVSFLQIRW